MIAVLDERRLQAEETDDVREAIALARSAQAAWAERSLRERAKLIGSLRAVIAESADELAAATAVICDRPVAEKMVSEVLPLAATARFLQKRAPRILRTQRHGSAGRPLWLWGTSFEVQRKPHGVVLIVGPGNYPLFLPAAQMLHALVAGNAVLLKPAEGAAAPLEILRARLAEQTQIPADLVQILPATKEAAREAALLGVDKVFFTGSSENGRDLLALLAESNTPSVMELSGADAVLVRADADVALAAKAIRFALRLNNGNTCMAPHLIIVHAQVANELSAALAGSGFDESAIVTVRDDTEALRAASLNEHGLGASIFSRDEKAARRLAARFATGFVTINDLIVPTADPRFPFGGIRASGFGTTRGAEGLRAMTYPHCVARRRGSSVHLEEPRANDDELFRSYLLLAHGRGWGARLQALRGLIELCRERLRK